MSLITSKLVQFPDPLAVQLSDKPYSISELQEMFEYAKEQGMTKCIISKRCHNYFNELYRAGSMDILMNLSSNLGDITGVTRVGIAFKVPVYLLNDMEFPHLSDDTSIDYDIVFVNFLKRSEL